VGLGNQGGGLIGGRFDIAGYLDYQGKRFIERFDANAYLAILRTMDTWDPQRGYVSATSLSRIRARLSFVGISSDWLFPPEAVRHLRTRFARPEWMPTTGDDNRPWPRRVPGRAGGTGSAAAINQPDHSRGKRVKTRFLNSNPAWPGTVFLLRCLSPYAGPECRRVRRRRDGLPQALKNIRATSRTTRRIGRYSDS